jgi:hypothetical protein
MRQPQRLDGASKLPLLSLALGFVDVLCKLGVALCCLQQEQQVLKTGNVSCSLTLLSLLSLLSTHLAQHAKVSVIWRGSS